VSAEGNGRRPSIFERLRRALRGVDRAEAPGLPIGEALHPVALAAVLVLVVNDWVLKPWIGPSAVTGKLSDVAGLAFAPVVLGARLDPSLSRRRLLACTLATGAVFAAVKLDAAAAGLLAELLSWLGRPATIYLDRTDLLCLPALAIAVWIGRDELRRVPLGRPAAIHRLARSAEPALADVRWAGAPGERVARLAAAIDGWDAAAVDALLAAPR
jgi:hypothetical protein